MGAWVGKGVIDIAESIDPIDKKKTNDIFVIGAGFGRTGTRYFNIHILVISYEISERIEYQPHHQINTSLKQIKPFLQLITNCIKTIRI